MKYQVAFVLILLILGAVLLLTGCGNDDGVSKYELTSKKLRNSVWLIESVTVDNVDRTSMYPGVTLSFQETSYTTTNGNPFWLAGGVWQFTDDDATTILFDNQIEMNIEELTDNALTLKFTWNKTTFRTGRLTSISGTHMLKFRN